MTPETSQSNTEDTQKPKKESFFIELFKFTLISVAIVVPIRLFVASPFIVSGSSMDPTFENGQYLIVDQLSYRFKEPERGEVVIFHYPKDPSKFFIKRVIGLPGETVELQGDTIKITNDEHPEGFFLDEAYLTFISENEDHAFILRPDEYVVLGDNRTASSDSRSWGVLKKDLIIGKAFLRLLPIDSINVLPGDIRIDSK